MPMFIYDWGTRPTQLAFILWPDAHVVAAEPEDTAARIVEQLEPRVAAGDTLLFHLNVTRGAGWPPDRAALLQWLAARGVRVLNGGLLDTSKREIQRLNRALGLPSVHIGPDAPPGTPVIVKTNRNYGGGPERRLSAAQRSALGMLPEDARIAGFDGYELREVQEVPAVDWADPHLAIERYVRNRRHVYHRCYFAGERCVVSEAVNPDPIQKMRPGLPRVDWCLPSAHAELPERLRRLLHGCQRLRAAVGLDFGAIDVVSDDAGTSYIIDVNGTPGRLDESRRDIPRHLRGGV